MGFHLEITARQRAREALIAEKLANAMIDRAKRHPTNFNPTTERRRLTWTLAGRAEVTKYRNAKNSAVGRRIPQRA